MFSIRLAAEMILVGTMALIAGVAWGQNYPNKTIRVVTSGLGGGGDITARLIAPALAARLEQQVLVENRPSGVIPGETVANAPPDGYTLLLTGSSFFIGPLMQKTPYDPVRDFSPITLIAREPSILVVHPSLPTKSVKELIALAKARPGELNYSSTGISINAMFAPAKTPAPIINRLNQEMVRELNQADVKEKLLNMAQESVGSSPEELADFIRSDMARQGKVIRDVGIRAQ